MPQRDYLMQQLEEMGYFLASLIRRLLKLKEEGLQDEITGILEVSIQEKLSFNMNDAIVLDNDEFLKLMKEHFKTEDQLEELAKLLMLTGNSVHSLSLTRINYLDKALVLYTHLQETSENFSFTRKDKIMEIRQMLSS